MQNIFGINALEPINKNAYIITDGDFGCIWDKADQSEAKNPDYLYQLATEEKVFTLLVNEIEYPVKFVFRKITPKAPDYREWAVESLVIITATGLVSYTLDQIDGTNIKLYSYYMRGEYEE